MPKGTVVVILGGGQGSRLFPLTRDRAKPAVSFGGKYRLIDIPVTNCLSSGLDRIFILTQFNSFSLNRHIWQAYGREVTRNGFIDVVAAEQTTTTDTWFQGTADAVRKSLQHILTHNPRNVLILSGDQIYHFDFRKLLDWHRQKEADVTICGRLSRPEETRSLGVVKVGRDMTVAGFYEKPKDPSLVADFNVEGIFTEASATQPFLCSMGIYLFRTEKLVQALANSESDFGHSIIPQTAKDMRMLCYPYQGYWEDVGTIKSFYDANMLWREGKGISVIFGGGDSIITNSRQLSPSRIDSKLTDSLVADGCDLRAAEIVRSIIGLRATIDEGCHIHDSIICGNDDYKFDRTYTIAKDCSIHKAILDKNVVVGAGSRIENLQGVQEGQTPWGIIRDGIVVIPKDTIIPAGTIF